VTEQEWLAATEPYEMLKGIWHNSSARKLRLFAVACCRSVLTELMDERGRGAVEVAERFAENNATDGERRLARHEAQRARGAASDRFTKSILRATYEANHSDAGQAASSSSSYIAPGGTYGRVEQLAQVRMLRCIFNPFRTVTFSLEWRTSTTVLMAQHMYESRDFSAMPILADALQESGCENEDVFSHCRGSAPHVRGCWVVDQVLGKE